MIEREPLSLLERLEKAAGPDTQLDSDIMWELSEWVNVGGWRRKHKVTGQTEGYTYRLAPAYTSSLDAAMTLKPKNAWFEIIESPGAEGSSFYCVVTWITKTLDGKRTLFANPSSRAMAPTPALALCIAALRASGEVG